MDANLMLENLPEDDSRTLAKCDANGPRKISLDAVSLRRIGSGAFAESLGILKRDMGGLKNVAAWLGVNAISTLSEWGGNVRAVPFSVALNCLGHEAAGRPIVNAVCLVGGYPMPVRDEVQLTHDQALEIARVRDFMGPMWMQGAGEAYARKYHRVSIDLFNAAVDYHLRSSR